MNGERNAAWAGAALVAAAVAGAAWWWSRDPAAGPAEPPPTPGQRAEALLARTDGEAAAAAAAHLARVADFFESRKAEAGAFAARATSIEGGWLLVAGRLGVEDREAHARFLRAAFEEHLFTPDQVQQVLDAAVAGYRRDLERADGRFVVDLRADLPDAEVLSPELVRAAESGDAFREAYARLVAAALPAVEGQVAGAAASELSAFYLGNLAARGVLRAGAAAGLVGTGWGSVLAVNLGVGLAIDQLIDWILGQLGFDPAGEVAAAARRSLDGVRAAVVDGDPAAAREYDALRAREREAGPAERDGVRAAADALALSGRLGLARQFGLMREARAAVRREIARQALAAPAAGGAE